MLSTMSSTTAAEDKAALRRQVRLTLDGLSPDALRRSDDALFAAFSALPQVEAASTIFAFSFLNFYGRAYFSGNVLCIHLIDNIFQRNFYPIRYSPAIFRRNYGKSIKVVCNRNEPNV